MSLRQQLTGRGTMQVATAGGLRSQIRLLNSKRTLRLNITVRATVNVTTLATAVINKGSAAALLRLYVNENGRDRVNVDARVASHLSACYAAGQPTNIRQTAVAVASYNIVEHIVLHFSPRQSVVPSETCFSESGGGAPLFLESDAYANGFARLFTGGAGSITALSVECEQEYVDEASVNAPFFITTMREQVENITSANTAYPVMLRTAHRLRGFVLTQDTDSGEVSDILTTVALRSDTRDIIGPNPVTYDNFAQYMESEQAGAVYFPMGAADTTRARSHVFVNFQQEGRLSRVLYPARDYTNLRLELGTAVSAGANPKLRITYIELERPDPVDGRIVVNPFLPKELI